MPPTVLNRDTISAAAAYKPAIGDLSMTDLPVAVQVRAEGQAGSPHGP